MTIKDVPWLGVKVMWGLSSGVQTQTDSVQNTSSSAQQQCEQGQNVLISQDDIIGTGKPYVLYVLTD